MLNNRWMFQIERTHSVHLVDMGCGPEARVYAEKKGDYVA